MTQHTTILDPFYGQPDARLLAARDATFADIARRPLWASAFGDGRMVGILIAAAPDGTELVLRGYSGLMELDAEARHYFVSPVYDLTTPDDFYRSGERVITALNHRIATLEEACRMAPSPAVARNIAAEIDRLREERAQRSVDLQREIFRHFVFQNAEGTRRDLIDIFERTRHTLPPGGAGECAAPRLLHYAYCHRLRPQALAEFWYGPSPTGERRVHGCWYPACMEKCAPILEFLLPGGAEGRYPLPCDKPTDTLGLAPNILYEDDDIVAIDKPAGMLSVPGKMNYAHPNTGGADDVESWLGRRLPTCPHPMLVHRLDMATSGIMVAAKSAAVHKALQSQFMSRAVGKRYLAWLDGTVASACGTISLPLCPNPEDRPRQVVDSHYGKPSLTRYEVLRTLTISPDPSSGATPRTLSLVACYPQTGRTHQIRVHAADVRGLGAPVVGDALYGRQTPALPPHPAFTEQRLYLHAESISFFHPTTRKPMLIHCPTRSLPFSI